MKPVVSLITFFILLISLATKAENDSTLKRFAVLDEYARNVPKQYETNIKILAEYLMKPAKSEMEKARLVYSWVATHMKYDAAAFNSGKYTDQSTEAAFKKRRAVCEGYSNIVLDLGVLCGLQVEKVVGYAKGYGYKQGKKFKKTDHAWNAIKVDGEWILIDATWGSGYGTTDGGKLKATSKFDPYWFNVDPHAFIFNHLPEDNQWQLTKETITLRQYEKLQRLDDTFFKLGFDAKQVFDDAMSGNVEKFAETYSTPLPVKGVKIPYTFKLKDTSTFVLEAENTEQMILLDGKNWLTFQKEGDTFSLTYAPKHKKVMILMKHKKSDKEYATIIRYHA